MKYVITRWVKVFKEVYVDTAESIEEAEGIIKEDATLNDTSFLNYNITEE